MMTAKYFSPKNAKFNLKSDFKKKQKKTPSKSSLLKCSSQLSFGILAMLAHDLKTTGLIVIKCGTSNCDDSD